MRYVIDFCPSSHVRRADGLLSRLDSSLAVTSSSHIFVYIYRCFILVEAIECYRSAIDKERYSLYAILIWTFVLIFIYMHVFIYNN